MKTRLTLAMIALIAGLSAIPAFAAEHSAELWHVSRTTDPGSGKFNYCAVESGFDNGLYLAFARNRDFNTNIVVSFPDKRLQDHTKYRMLVGVDNYPVRDTVGFAAASDILVLPLQHDRKILDWLQKGKLLDLKGPQDSVKFSLDGAQDAFKKLQQCVEDSLKDEAQGIRPAPASAPGDIAKPVDDMVLPLPLPAAKAVSSPSVAAPEAAKPMAIEAASVSPAIVSPPAVQAAPQASAKAADIQTKPAAVPALKPDVVVASTPQPQAVQAPAVAVSKPVQAAPAESTPSAPAHVSMMALLEKAGFSPAEKCTDKSSSCTWSKGSFLGSIVQSKAKSDFLDAVMDDTDRYEKNCQGQFSSSIGAPMQSKGLTTAEATLTCTKGAAATSYVMLYIQASDRLLVATESGPSPKQADAVAQRQKLEASLPQATNYQ